jgi:Tfp pilus assembly protein PilZ
MPGEKRTYPRTPILLSVTVSDGNRFLKEFVHDVSPGGLMIESSQRYEIGTMLDMVIDTHVPVKTKGSVAWVRKVEHTYKMGVQFIAMNAKAATGWAEFLNRERESPLSKMELRGLDFGL